MQRIASASLALLFGLAGSAARADEAEVPGPLRPLPPITAPRTGASATPARAPVPLPPSVTAARPPAPVRAWAGVVRPVAPGQKVAGRVTADAVAHEIRIQDLALADGNGLEVWLVAADALASTDAVLGAKRVSIGKVRRLKPLLVFRYPAELDLSVYRSLIVWARSDRAPRAQARLAPARGN